MIKLPGLLRYRMRSGNIRLLVRVEGNKDKRITLKVKEDHPDFFDFYKAARRGVQLVPEDKPEDKAIKGSFGWLVTKYFIHLEKNVEAGLYSAKTFKKTKQALEKLKTRYFEYVPILPTKHIIKLRDEKRNTPAAADDMVEKIRVMYKWALDQGYVDHNPAIGVPKIYRKGKGALPWSLEDVYQFTSHHKKGTNAHLAITLLLFTACRIEDLTLLGPEHIQTVKDYDSGKTTKILAWQPLKKGSSFVQIPIVGPLWKEIKGIKTGTFLVNSKGKPYSSGDTMSATFSDWAIDAKLKSRTAHGIRKGVGKLLAEIGCTQYEIMAIHGHSEAKTSETYTKDAERLKLASVGMEKIEKRIKW